MGAGVLGSLVRARRRDLGFLAADVANIAGLEEAWILAIERGEKRPSVLDLEKLGRALVFDPADILQKRELGDPRRLPGWFQSHEQEHLETQFAARDVRTLLLAAEVGRIGGFLLRSLKSRTPRIIGHRRVQDIQDAIADGKRLGAEVHTELCGDDKPIVSLQSLLEHLDVHVAAVPFSNEEKSAVSIVQSGAVPVVLLNSSGGRYEYVRARRMTLAHELAHILCDGGEMTLDGPRRPRAADVETRANNFAPNFLAPPALVCSSTPPEPTKAREVCLEVAKTWGLSLSGAAHHAANVGLIAKHEAANIENDGVWRRAASKSIRDYSWERGTARRDTERSLGLKAEALAHGLISDLVVAAVEEAVISPGRGREILKLA